MSLLKKQNKEVMFWKGREGGAREKPLRKRSVRKESEGGRGLGGKKRWKEG